MPERIKHFGRRSKLEIACDTLKVISEGAERPTNIMYRSNLTWPLTIAYLEVLLRHRMIARDLFEKRNVYRITPKGSSLLRMYTGLQEEAEELELDKIDLRMIPTITTSPGLGAEIDASVDSVRRLLEKAGYRTSTILLRGLSGVEHRFDLVATNDQGTRIGCFVRGSVAQTDVIQAFTLQLDCEIQTCVICREYPSKEVSNLAESYGLKVIAFKDLSSTSLTETT